MALEGEVQSELRDLIDATGPINLATLREGGWLLPVVRDSLLEYRHADLDWLASRHEGLAGEALMDARIADAQQRAMLAGALSAGLYASIVCGTLITGGLVSALAMPVAATTFGIDLYYTARIQIRLGWDLAVLHGHPVDVDDEAQLLELAQISYGVDVGGPWQPMAAGLVPIASRFGTRAATLTSRATYAGAMRVLGRRLVQQGLGRFAVPAIGVPLCAGVNWITTGRIGDHARRVFRGHRMAREQARELAAEVEACPRLLLEALLWIAGADGRYAGVEVRLVEELAELLDEGTELLRLPEEAEWLEDLARAPAGIRREVYGAALHAAALDGVLHTEEDRRLRDLAKACGVPFDARAVTAAIMSVRGRSMSDP